MFLFCTSLGVLVVSALVAMPLRDARTSGMVGAGGAVLGCLVGLVPALQALLFGERLWLRLPWMPPYGSFSLEIDALSGFFLVPIFLLCGLAAVYGRSYLAALGGRRRLGPAWLFFNLLVASMALVVTARNGLLFLVAWEVMALASFFLVCLEHEKRHVREAGWTYLVATHLGTAFLLVLFALLGPAGGSLDFEQFSAAGLSGPLFLLALVGFGAKAGFMPLHVWLPEAHPAAPSHVSAVMSGVMIKTGIYGFLRILTFLGPAQTWWGVTLVAVGAVSGVCGVVFALAQHDLKRLLAYHSVENIGIIALGLGVGVLGLANGLPALAAIGFAGGLLHVLNHALFKGLLFLGAGAVLHGAGTGEIEHLGGLMKRMPATGLCFFVGSAAICGLPPLNGFVSEFLIYLGAFRGGGLSAFEVVLPCIAVIVALALIGGLAVACFTKAFGIVFLGEPRSQDAARAHEPSRAMLAPMIVLAGLCLAVGLAAPLALRGVAPAVQVLLPSGVSAAAEFADVGSWLATVSLAGGLFLVLAGLLAGLRLLVLRGRPKGRGVTWDCGYAEPTPRMQYTASSFAQPLAEMFRHVLWTRERIIPPEGCFPKAAAFHSETPDVAGERLYGPLFTGLTNAALRLRWLQHGRIQIYILYILVTLLVLLVWKFR